MVPDKLDDWTYEIVEALCKPGRPESDRHDFKFEVRHIENAAKLCCAFANSYGGFIIIGVKEVGKGDSKRFEIVGLNHDLELYANFLNKVKVEPDIAISEPKIINVPNSTKLLYVLEIPLSPRRPHLPLVADQRIFWKRWGSGCVQMTLDEVRNQMISFEEKREKLSLILIAIREILNSFDQESSVVDGSYYAGSISTDIFDKIIVETYSLLKIDHNLISYFLYIRRHVSAFNAKKLILITTSSGRHDIEYQRNIINNYKQEIKTILPTIKILVESIEVSLKAHYGIVNPYNALN